MEIKRCRNCGDTFKMKYGSAYCPTCRQLTRSQRTVKILESQCGKCKKCGKQLHSRIAIHCQRCKLQPQGSKHWNWRGGVLGSGRGYKKVYLGRVNGKTTYILEHHLIWEQTNHRKLPKGYLVHHLNGIKDDNRIENLAAIPRSKHSVWTLVELAQRRIRKLEQLHLFNP